MSTVDAPNSPSAPPPDDQVVKAVCDGDSEQFALLVVRHAPIAFALAQRFVRDWHTAEDITQEALLDSFIRLKQLRDPVRYRPWLMTIVRNRCQMLARSRHDDETPRAEMEDLVDTAYQSPEAILLQKNAWSILGELCNQLSPSEAPVARLYYLDGKRTADIAAELGITVASVESRLHKARNRVARSGDGSHTRALMHALITHMRERYVMDAIRLELSQDLLHLVDHSAGDAPLLRAITEMRSDLQSAEALAIPKVHVVDNLALPSGAYELYVQGLKIHQGAPTSERQVDEIVGELRTAIRSNRHRISEDA